MRTGVTTEKGWQYYDPIEMRSEGWGSWGCGGGGVELEDVGEVGW